MRHIKYKDNGSISLEACIVVPLFVLLLMFIYGFIVFFSGHFLLSHSLIQSAQSLSLDPFATERLNTNWSNSQDTSDVVNAMYASLLTDQSKYYSSNEKWYSENSDLLHETVKNRFLGYFAGDENSNDIKTRADDKLKYFGVQGGLSGIDFSETKIEDNVLTLTITYRQEFVFNFQGLAAFDRKQTISITMWDI